MLSIFVAGSLCAQSKIYGRITDTQGQGLSFANVVVEGTSRGTSSNLDGYYALSLEPGRYTLVFQYVGYQTQRREIMLGNEDQELNLPMPEALLQLQTITVLPGQENPAYEIIRQAQAKRRYYREEEYQSYQCQIYTKIFERSQREGGNFNLFGASRPIQKGVFYLSETLSELSFRQKNRFHEKVLAAKVSGDTTGYSYNRANWLNFYNNQSLRMNDQSIYSPIAEQAFQYYDFRLEGTETESGQKIHKIAMFPKFKNAPVFTGHVYILEGSWRIHSLDAHIGPGVAAPFDSTAIRQIYVPLENKQVWVPFSFTGYFQLFNGEVQAYYHAIATDYALNPELPETLFGSEVLSYTPEAGRQNLDFWENLRPIPLTEEEVADYAAKDAPPAPPKEEFSVEDDLDTLAQTPTKPKFRLGALLFGNYTLRMGQNTRLRFDPLLNTINFNTVEGWRLAYQFQFIRDFGPTKSLSLTPFFRYGFANARFQAKLRGEYQWRNRPGRLMLEGGQFVAQLAGYKLIDENINTLYSLLREDNYLKLYEKTFAALQFEQEWFNGFRTTLGATFARRRPLQNNSTQTWADREEKEYTPNAPFNAEQANTAFEAHEALVLSASVKIAFRQEYIMRPNGKQVERVRGPELELGYRRGLADLDYDFVRAYLSDQFRLGVLGRTRLAAEAGRFFEPQHPVFSRFSSLCSQPNTNFAGSTAGGLSTNGLLSLFQRQ
ncbi:MAG: carboxypeptidase-like regulatory domain-containing protein [Microscillaceae bacterium]|nr:carboxypeptidase-like regulatory domain-containing protein [Microscillaceae bacterium]